MNKYLIIGPAWVGDMVMAQTLFRLLKQRDSACQIDVLAPAWTHPLLNRMPEITHAIVSPFKRGELAFFKRRALGKRLSDGGYTQAIILPNSWKSALVPFFAGIKIRTGWVGECRYGLLNDGRRLDKSTHPLMIDRFMALAYPRLSTNKPANPLMPLFQCDQEQVNASVQKLGLVQQDKKILALCPGAEFGPSKRWPADSFAAVANAMLNSGWQVWLFGSPNDATIGEAIMTAAHQQCVNLIGKTSLPEAIDLLSIVNKVVCNDSGLMHIAAALSRDTVAVYGSTSTAFTPPLSSTVQVLKNDIACAPCFKRECPLVHHKCMTDLLPSTVLHAIGCESKGE